MALVGVLSLGDENYPVGLVINPLSGSIYGAYGSGGPADMEMWLPGEGASLPSSVGTITYPGSAADAGIYAVKAFTISPTCNFLYAGAYSDPSSEILAYDMTTGKVVPTFGATVSLPTSNYASAGAVE